MKVQSSSVARSASGVCGALLGLTLAGPSHAQEVDRVVVTGTRFVDDAARLPIGASVLTAADLKRAGVSSVAQALTRLLGVTGRLDLGGGGDYSFDLRGFGGGAGGNQVIVVDGQRVSEADLSSTRLAGIPIDSIERIEVLRGSGAVAYGEGATAGVIAITTRAGAAGASTAPQASGQVVAEAGSFASRALRAGVALGVGDWSLDVHGERRLSDGHRANFASAASAGALAMRWQSAAHDPLLALAWRLAEDRLATGLPGSLTAAQFAADPHQSTSPDDHASQRNTRSTLQATLRPVGGWTLVADGGARSKASRSVFVGSGFSYDYNVAASQWGLRARHEAVLAGARNQFSIGYDDNRWQRDVLGAFGSLGTQSNRGVYLQDDVTLAGGTRLGAGVRRELLDKRYDPGYGATRLQQRLSAWELSLLQPLAADWQAWGRVGRSFRLANVDEFSYTQPGVLLKPQTSNDAEIGLRWQRGRSRAELRLYRHALRDEIGFDPAAAGPFGPGGANVNFDRTRRQGAELDLRHALSPALELRGNAAWRQARFASGVHDGRDVPLVPRGTLSFGAWWQPLAGHSIDASARHLGAQHPDLDNACRVAAATVVDLRYAYTQPRWEVALAATNLGDRRYTTQAFACAGSLASAVYPEPGRAWQATLRVDF